MRLEKEPFLFRAIPWFIGGVFVLVVVSWITVAVLLGKLGDEIGTHGLKAVIESVWCGKDGCK